MTNGSDQEGGRGGPADDLEVYSSDLVICPSARLCHAWQAKKPPKVDNSDETQW